MKSILTEEIAPDTYGITPENPLLTNGINYTLAILDNLVTNNHQYILYHRYCSFFSSLAGHPIDIYQLCSADGQRFDVFVDIYNEKTEWIPPFGFKFVDPIIQYYDGWGNLHYTCVDEQHVIDIKPYIKKWSKEANGFVFDTENPQEYQRIMTNSFGVDYFEEKFPVSLIEKYLFEQSVIIDDLSESQQKQRDVYYKNRRKELNRFKWKHSTFRLFLQSLKFRVHSTLFPSVPPMPY